VRVLSPYLRSTHSDSRWRIVCRSSVVAEPRQLGLQLWVRVSRHAGAPALVLLRHRRLRQRACCRQGCPRRYKIYVPSNFISRADWTILSLQPRPSKTREHSVTYLSTLVMADIITVTRTCTSPVVCCLATGPRDCFADVVVSSVLERMQFLSSRTHVGSIRFGAVVMLQPYSFFCN